jgi:hypothetical protein
MHSGACVHVQRTLDENAVNACREQELAAASPTEQRRIIRGKALWHARALPLGLLRRRRYLHASCCAFMCCVIVLCFFSMRSLIGADLLCPRVTLLSLYPSSLAFHLACVRKKALACTCLNPNYISVYCVMNCRSRKRSVAR